ncbi:MAG: LysR family transcriptional regulator [Rhodovulum sulfidophilum]|uniref:LysR family transcriptional regulator n=1 Tax=Rhodovulum sulfidophilum TaxID=35806 RepID=A0A2W5NBN2_RHOSU|nr:MAG: LysR family transcriptional regulator [Rhodovulum sulfidophilum]
MDEFLDRIPTSLWRLLPRIARAGSLSLAARASGISQPAATKLILRAEEICGVALLRRDRRPLELTAEGLLLLDFAERRNALAAQAQDRLREGRGAGRGLARIASFGASASTHLLPGLVDHVARRWPGLRVEITEDTDRPALRALSDGLVDFATTLDHEDWTLELIPMAHDRLIALVRADDALAGRDRLDAASLADRPFILTRGGSEPLLREWFARQGLEPRVSHRIQQITSILAMVRAGMGVSVIAEMAVPETHDGVVAVPLSPGFPRTICLARRAGSFGSLAAERVWRLAERHFAPD